MDTRSKGRSTDVAESRRGNMINSASRNSNTPKSIIALAYSSSSSLAAAGPPTGDLVKLPDPFADGYSDKMFVLFPSTSTSSSSSSTAQEIHQLSSIRRKKSSLSSFFVNNPPWVCSNGNLHILNPVDPLFLLLPFFPADGVSNTDSWQPMTQILSKVPNTIQKAIDASQLGHFFDCYNNDDLILYKFQRKRVLQWLLAKHGKVMATLSKQHLEKKKRDREEEALKVLSSMQSIKAQKVRDGAFSSSFRFEDNTSGVLSKPLEEVLKTPESVPTAVVVVDISSEEQHILYLSALQIVCQNLSTTWRSAFLTSLNNSYSLTEEDLWSAPSTKINSATINGGGSDTISSGQKRPHDEMNHSIYAQGIHDNITSIPPPVEESGGNTGNPTSAGKNPTKGSKVPTASQGLKQLAKVNTKGMKKMELFFHQKPNDK